MAKVNCNECDAEISIPEDSMQGEIVTCPDCGESFELVKSGDKFSTKPAQVVGEDWGQ
ncbi:MAG: lysine biosynthesis protein LysW [Thermoproteota archaeon]|jgi:alpha-aminoadipate carrier protein LysW|nr:lysine biosynthesis protein LysW [Thermoproteota archaeon]